MRTLIQEFELDMQKIIEYVAKLENDIKTLTDKYEFLRDCKLKDNR
jgi:hypothetical protein